MLIAQQKLKENIAEYILYMYQIEDVIRAYKFDLERIMDEYVRGQLPDQKNDIELVFHAMYMKLLLRLQKKEINTESEEAFDNMRVMIAYLSRAYHQMKNGELNFFNN